MEKITRKFETVDELDQFVSDQSEAGRKWDFDRVQKRAWILVSETEAEQIQKEEIYL